MNKPISVLAVPSVTMVALALGLAGCAGSVKPPTGEKRTAESSLQQAVASDARDYEPVLLNEAQNKLADAEALMSDEMTEEQYQDAAYLLQQASVDAQLAGARAETAKAERAVEEINRNIESLRTRMNESQ